MSYEKVVKYARRRALTFLSFSFGLVLLAPRVAGDKVRCLALGSLRQRGRRGSWVLGAAMSRKRTGLSECFAAAFEGALVRSFARVPSPVFCKMAG